MTGIATPSGKKRSSGKSILVAGGVPTTFHTANGDMPGRVVEGVAVTVGPLLATNIKIGVGLAGGRENDALLGQSFLSQFDIRMEKNQLILHLR